ncbi:GPI mannosyltransferase 3 [Aricia agestis]|uniref:GPI mannosyltransferase 3 n=1 Tax=Aricia agestis TaxID=91739 RepID=UPI001C201D34|nr:GPI mannosyltransferase 3 [Aricia agestis]XP_041969640.1 GPI mannosyltransferase 3 [Aricia agestis]XP_041969641.1 GPI mannosyltransferase 3 [Aricia agestis]
MALLRSLRPTQVLSAILIVRILSVFVVQTWYVPDEYWQTLEVAHKQAFGYGTLTWEWQKGIRSFLYPSIVTALYYLLKVTNLDYPEALVLLPRILQAIISSAADYSFYKWSGNRKWALFLILTSWFWFYTCSRTLLQTLETALVAIALSLFPFKEGKLSHYQKEDNRWIWLACTSVFVRPTSAPLWIVLGLYNLVTTNQGRPQLLLQTYLPIGVLAGGALVALDSFFYGKLIITPWEFFKLNVLKDIASFYGKHPWHWYITQGLPAVLGINILPVIWGIAKILRRPKENKIGTLLLSAAALHVALHSYIPHKEFRFVLPLLPILLYIAQDVIVPWSRKAEKWQLYTLALALLVGNAIPAAYFGLIHQKATLEVMPLLRENISNNRTSILFAMPCHSTPLYSHLHANVSTRYLSCDPPPPGETYESEVFFNNPNRWWAREFAVRQPPTLVVLFDVLRGRLDGLRDYRLLHELPHTQFPEGEVSEKVLVYQRKEARPKVQTDEVV